MASSQTSRALAAELRAELGPLLDSRTITRLLGFRTNDACIKALRTGALGIPAFRLPGRPGYFVLTDEFARWLDQNRQDSTTPTEQRCAGHTNDQST